MKHLFNPAFFWVIILIKLNGEFHPSFTRFHQTKTFFLFCINVKFSKFISHILTKGLCHSGFSTRILDSSLRAQIGRYISDGIVKTDSIAPVGLVWVLEFQSRVLVCADSIGLYLLEDINEGLCDVQFFCVPFNHKSIHTSTNYFLV